MWLKKLEIVITTMSEALLKFPISMTTDIGIYQISRVYFKNVYYWTFLKIKLCYINTYYYVHTPRVLDIKKGCVKHIF